MHLYRLTLRIALPDAIGVVTPRAVYLWRTAENVPGLLRLVISNFVRGGQQVCLRRKAAREAYLDAYSPTGPSERALQISDGECAIAIEDVTELPCIEQAA